MREFASLRLRCACTLLASCGEFFQPGTTSGNRLEVLLHAMRRYEYYWRPALTVDAVLALEDVLRALRPQMVSLYSSAAEAESALVAIELAELVESAAEAHEVTDDEDDAAAAPLPLPVRPKRPVTPPHERERIEAQ